MGALSIVLLLVGVAGAVIRPWSLPPWTLPVGATAVGLVSGAVDLRASHGAVHAVHQLDQPIGFLLAAVPLAVLLDRLGFFAACAQLLTRGRHPVGGLWILAALVTTVLNLDAGVVLLTPLYVDVARRSGRDPLTLAFQPVVLSWLASSALPVSNLTNLIAVTATGASAGAFLGHLGLPSLVAATVGWLCYRRLVLPGPATAVPAAAVPATAGPVPAASAGGRSRPGGTDDPGGSRTGRAPLDVPARRALAAGGLVVAAVLVGFVLGRPVGIEEWEVALAADAVLVGLLARRLVRTAAAPFGSSPVGSGRAALRADLGKAVPWRAVPVGTALVAGALAVLADAAVAHVAVGRLLGGDSIAGLARSAGVAALLGNAVNNLPALLVLVPGLGHHPTPTLWAVLVGVNMGPVLLVTGTLASLLWLETLRRLGVVASGRDLSRIGVRVGLPGALAGVTTLLVLHATGVAP